MSGTDDGLSQSEKVNLLFKNYMNFTTTSDSKKFYEEILIPNNTNIFSSNILTNLPPQTPSYSIVSSHSELRNYLIYSGLTDISINNQWFLSKTNDFDASFSVNSTDDGERTVLRLTKIKLDYVGSNSSAFICKDNEGKNILQNLIPSNFSPQGYSLSLHYNHNGVLKDIGWTLSRSTVSNSQIGSSVNFGGALFDSKNGVITFYDVLGTPSAVFQDISNNFYLSASKYIGIKGISTLGRGSAEVDITSENILKFKTNGIERLIIDASGNSKFSSSDPSYVAIDINSTSGIKLPKGNTSERPLGNPDISGVIRYNTETQQFEGYATAWQGLGGVIDVDQDTKIIAENNPNDDNDELKFFTGGITRMVISNDGTIDVSENLHLETTLDVSGATRLDNTLYVKNTVEFDNNLDVSGATH